MRVVLDTNVLFAAFAARGICSALVEACLQSHQIVVSEHILAELAEHLTDKLRVPERQVEQFEELLRAHADVVVPTDMPVHACRDADDLPVLGTALAGSADVLVTGDMDLLCLNEVGRMPIVTPRAFYEMLKLK